MAQFIIEMGSGNTCRNDVGKVREMIDAVADVDTGKHEVVMKWQLFETALPNEPLLWSTFAYAYGYAWERGYQTTASVFDVSSLAFLERFDVPFVKIANRPKLYYLARMTEKPCYVSVRVGYGFVGVPPSEVLECVSSYPATVEDYEAAGRLPVNISDHTPGWDLYHRAQPAIIEKHFVLEHDPDNPDGGPFAVTPEQLAEVL